VKNQFWFWSKFIPVLVSKQGSVLYPVPVLVPELNPKFKLFPIQTLPTKPKPLILTCQTPRKTDLNLGSSIPIPVRKN
jgi:hypothetical protein